MVSACFYSVFKCVVVSGNLDRGKVEGVDGVYLGWDLKRGESSELTVADPFWGGMGTGHYRLEQMPDGG